MERNTAPCCEDVRDKQGEAAVVVEPPDIDGSSSLLGALLELGDVSHDLLCQWPIGDNGKSCQDREVVCSFGYNLHTCPHRPDTLKLKWFWSLCAAFEV